MSANIITYLLTYLMA